MQDAGRVAISPMNCGDFPQDAGRVRCSSSMLRPRSSWRKNEITVYAYVDVVHIVIVRRGCWIAPMFFFQYQTGFLCILLLQLNSNTTATVLSVQLNSNTTKILLDDVSYPTGRRILSNRTESESTHVAHGNLHNYYKVFKIYHGSSWHAHDRRGQRHAVCYRLGSRHHRLGNRHHRLGNRHHRLGNRQFLNGLLI